MITAEEFAKEINRLAEKINGSAELTLEEYQATDERLTELFRIDGDEIYQSLLEKLSNIPISEPVTEDELDEPAGHEIVQKEFKGTGLGKASIAELAERNITTVEQLVELGEEGINQIKGVSDEEASKIWVRANEILANR